MSRDHRKLRAYELSHRLVLSVYRATRSYPPEEKFGLVSQMRRAAASVPANIVEGCGRFSEKELIQSLNIAFGSLREVGYFIELSHDLGMLNDVTHTELTQEHNETARVLAALMNKLRQG